MAPAPQFIMSFRGVEIGRYDTAERAMAAARSLIDTELGVLLGRGELAPGKPPVELPRIEWQPPPVPFPFDAGGYWHWRAQALASQRRPPTAPRPLPPMPKGDDAMAPRRSGEFSKPGHPISAPGGPPLPPDPPAATVITPIYDGPPQQPEDAQSEHRRWFGKDEES